MDTRPSVFKLEFCMRIDSGNLRQSDLEEIRG